MIQGDLVKPDIASFLSHQGKNQDVAKPEHDRHEPRAPDRRLPFEPGEHVVTRMTNPNTSSDMATPRTGIEAKNR